METKKKTTKKAQNAAKKLEKDIDEMEKKIDALEKIYNEKQTQKQLAEEKQRRLNEKLETIRNDLQTQLINQNKIGKQFDDMVEDYLFFVSLKESLQYDIKVNGIRLDVMTGNGFTALKDNKSIDSLIKTNQQMLKILQELDLKAPDEGDNGDGEEGDLL